MHEITGPYYQQFKDVTTVYYSYQEDLEEPFKQEGDRLLIKGKEEYGPAIMEKTVQAFEYFQSTLSTYDYVVRSNISTIIRFDLLQKELMNQTIAYGGFMKDLQWTDPSCGIHDSRWFGTLYASGICIIFSSNTIIQLLEHRHLINKEVIDDIAFGIFVKERSIASTDISPYVVWMRDHHRQTHELIQLLESRPNAMVYRNRVRPERPESRWEDIEQMQIIISFLNRTSQK
jgi:hypothetical protein